jgi:hypothetical protein
MGPRGEDTHPVATAQAVCGCCSEHFTLPPEGPLQKHLDELPFPVLVVDLYAGAYLITAAVNRIACDWIRKEPQENIQHLCGNVIECAYAYLPEGCCNTTACVSCALKQAVVRTSETGEPQVNVVFILQRGYPDHTAPVSLSITTMKTGRLVMLRFDLAG